MQPEASHPDPPQQLQACSYNELYLQPGLSLEPAEALKPPQGTSKKRLQYKMVPNFVRKMHLERPLQEQHVLNLFNCLAINENALRNPTSEESFITSKFYMKKVKKAEIRHGSLLLRLQNLQRECLPVSYICDRLKRLGHNACLEVAKVIQSMEETLPEVQKRLEKGQHSSQNNLESFLRDMRGKSFLSQYSPNLLIISGELLELLGYNTEEFAVEAIKHQCVLYEFFSSQHYARVIFKHLDNIKLLYKYFDGELNLGQVCKESLMVYEDWLYDRFNQKIRCRFTAGTAKQLTPFIEIIKLYNETEKNPDVRREQNSKHFRIQQYKSAVRDQEYEMLKKLIPMPKQFDPLHKGKICGYRPMTEPLSP